MPKFGTESMNRLNTVDLDLQNVFLEIVKHHDCKILSGKRSAEEQAQLYAENRSQRDGVRKKSMHQLGLAVDVAPYPVLWPDEVGICQAEKEHRLKRFHVFAGFVLGMAQKMGIDLRWGGDWDEDWIYNDQKFHDLPHFELKP